MSQFDVQSLENNFLKWRQERTPEEKESDAFEVYSIEQILKHDDIPDEDIESGRTGGGDDGGIDGIYIFINRQLVQAESQIPDNASTFDLVIIQAKYANSFTESTLEKFQAFSKDCFDWNVNPDAILYFNASVKSSIKRFREAADKVLGGSRCVFKVHFYYTTKSDYEPDPKIIARADTIRRYITTQITNAIVEFEFWGCAKFVQSIRSSPRIDEEIQISNYFPTPDGSVVCLTSLNSFAAFLRDEDGELKTVLLEPNVRAFQGVANPVNAGIKETLKDPAAGKIEFWWLNNGITIVAEK